MLRLFSQFCVGRRKCQSRRAAGEAAQVLEHRCLLTGTLSVAGLTSTGGRPNQDSFSGGISADGTLVVFSTDADGVVPGDTGGWEDVFVRNLVTGVTRRISQNAAGQGGDRDSLNPAISANGRYVVFNSYARNLVSNDNSSTSDVFLADLQLGTLELISIRYNGSPRGANRASYAPDVSNDGRFVTFQSDATNIVNNDDNDASDVFLFDRQTREMVRVSRSTTGGDANNDSFSPRISGNGQYVVYASLATNLISGDTNSQFDVFRFDRLTGQNVLVSRTPTAQANSWSHVPSISDDGRWVAFDSGASNLVPGDTNRAIDVFVADMQTGGIERVVGINGQGDSHSWYPVLSGDGNYVVIESDARNLVSQGNNNERQVYLYNRSTQAIELISTTPTTAGNNESTRTFVSNDGTRVVFTTAATNLVTPDTNGRLDVLVWSRTTTNHAPVVTNATQGMTRGWLGTPIDVVAPTDAEGDVLTVTITQLPSAGVVKRNGVAVTVNQVLTVSQFQALTYDSPTTGNHSDALGQLRYSVSDGSNVVTGFLTFTLAVPEVDIVFWDAMNGTWVFAENDGAGRLIRTGEVAVGETFIRFAGQADVNGDGFTDQVTLGTSGRWMVHLAGTTGVMEWARWTGGPYQYVQLGDFNGDGRDDIIGQAQSDGTWFVGLSNGTGFTQANFGRWNSTGWVDVRVGDFNGDGRADIAGLQALGAQWWVGLSSGASFTTNYYGQWEAGAGWRTLRVGDFDGDGNDDIITQDSTGRWYLGYGGSTQFVSQASARWSTHGWADILVGDFDGDGRDDLFGRHTGGSVWVLQSAGRTMTSQFRGFSMPGLEAVAAVGDFNGDGRDDVMTLSTVNGNWQIDTAGIRLRRTAYGTWDDTGTPFSVGSGLI